MITTDAAKRLFNINAPAGSPVMIEDKAYDEFMEDANKAGAMPDNKK